MTIREVYESCLVELNKVQAPALLLDDFNYLFNKAIQKYINKRYNLFEANQQLTDDLRVLLKTVRIDSNTTPYTLTKTQNINVFGADYTCTLPSDYLHILNCICQFNYTDKCGTKPIQVGANKLDTAEWPHSINNYYMRPSYKRPYFYIRNINDPTTALLTNGGRLNPAKENKTNNTRYGNDSIPVMQIKCGDGSVPGKLKDHYSLNAVFVDYLRAPEFVSLKAEDLDDIVDNTENLEFPDYVIYEIINELVTLMLENGRDQVRIQTQPAVAQSIPSGSSK